MIKKVLLILLITSSMNIFSNSGLSHTINSQLLVLDSDRATELLTSWCESNSGYYTGRSSDYMELRIPNDKLIDLKPFLKTVALEIVDFNQNSINVSGRISELKSGIKAREDALEQNLFYINSSDVEGTLSLEQEIRRLRRELNSYKGELRVLENDSIMAKVRIDITFKTKTINNNGYSPFDWINSVDFFTVTNLDMWEDIKGFGGVKTTIPDGFALVDNSPILKAISPQGGRFVADKIKNYPEQSLEFWIDALNNNLEQRGYVKINSGSTYPEDGDNPFILTSWGLTYGNKDHIYITGLRITRDNIEILQITTEAMFYGKYFN